MESAINDVRSKRSSLRHAAITHGVGKSTLHNRVSGKPFSGRRGKQLALSDEEERVVVESLKEFASNGTPLSRHDVMDLIAMMCASFPTSRRARLPFKDGRPGKRFLSGFIRRHPDLALKRRAIL